METALESDIVIKAFNRKEEASKRLYRAHQNSTFTEFNDAQKEWSEAFDNWEKVRKEYPQFVKPKPTELQVAASKYSTNDKEVEAFIKGAEYILKKHNIKVWSSDAGEQIPK